MRGSVRWLVRLAAGLLLAGLLLAACGAPTATPIPPASTPVPPPPTPAGDPYTTSQGGGEPRSAGYWLVWNACAPENRAGVARANGGRAAGWIILDDLLADPGVLVGPLAVETCEQGLALLRGQDAAGQAQPGDPAYGLAAQLLAAQANLAAGAEYCSASDQAVQAGQLLLLSLQFDGSGTYLGPGGDAEDREVARFLIEQLQAYNAGLLCVP